MLSTSNHNKNEKISSDYFTNNYIGCETFMSVNYIGIINVVFRYKQLLDNIKCIILSVNDLYIGYISQYILFT